MSDTKDVTDEVRGGSMAERLADRIFTREGLVGLIAAALVGVLCWVVYAVVNNQTTELQNRARFNDMILKISADGADADKLSADGLQRIARVREGEQSRREADTNIRQQQLDVWREVAASLKANGEVQKELIRLLKERN